VSEAKQRDGRRQEIADLFKIWWQRHGDSPVTASKLHDDVKIAVDPQRRGRQFLASKLEKLAGTRIAGFVLTRQPSSGKWGAATYALETTNEGEGHRDHRGHSNDPAPDGADATYAPDVKRGRGDDGHGSGVTVSQVPPIPPMPSGSASYSGADPSVALPEAPPLAPAGSKSDPNPGRSPKTVSNKAEPDSGWAQSGRWI
jgi:hypothetical protein